MGCARIKLLVHPICFLILFFRSDSPVFWETGEVMQVDQVTKLVYGAKNFWKFYLKDFIAVLKVLTDKQYKVFVNEQTFKNKV